MQQKPKDQIIDELRQQIDALEAERKQAEQAALEAKRYLNRLIESSPDAIISTDKKGNVVLFSEGAETLLGYRAKEVAGRSTSVLYGDEAGARQVALEMRKRGGTISSFESVMLAKDGSNIPVLISASVVFDEKGEEVGTVGFARDLRKRKRAAGFSNPHLARGIAGSARCLFMARSGRAQPWLLGRLLTQSRLPAKAAPPNSTA